MKLSIGTRCPSSCWAPAPCSAPPPGEVPASVSHLQSCSGTRLSSKLPEL